jgi:folylpolyglutamate synthase/dihydrofolate synthase
MGEAESDSPRPPSVVDTANGKADKVNERSQGEKVILRFKNPASHRNGPSEGTPEKPYVSPPAEKTGIHLGLKDMHSLVSLLEPLRTPYIHIAGTNGKGSVSAMIDSCAISAGLRTGRYNSPHLIVPRDAILLNGHPVSQDIYDHHRHIVKRTITDHHLQNSEFEIETATAFSIFANAEPPLDLLLVECGMGGLRDATNVLDKSRQICSILTVVDMDHQKFLGDTIEAIATDKLGITTSGGHLVVSKQIHHAVIDIVRQRAKEIGFSYEFADNGLSLEIALPGRHQQENASTAVAALKHIQSSPQALQIQPRAGIIGQSAIQLGLQRTQWRGRCSWIKLPGPTVGATGEIPLLVDGAHNESAATSLMNYIDSIRTDEPVVFIVGLSHSPPKTPLSVLRPILSRIRRTDMVLPVQFSTPVAGMPWISNVPGLDIQAAAIASGLSKDQILGSHLARTCKLQEGLGLAVKAQKWGFVVVTGSLYLVADAYRLAGE